VLVGVEEAYIHCSKHIPALSKRDKARQWGSDDPAHKGGDFFAVGSTMQDASTKLAPPSAHGGWLRRSKRRRVR
jgi:hypothetical protein